MSGPVAQTVALLEQELDALDQRRGEIESIIERLRPLAGGLPSAKAKKPQKRTDGATRVPTRRTLPDDRQTSEIVAAVRKAGGSMKPSELADALSVSSFTVRAWLKRAVHAKAVVITGATISRRVSLPGKAVAKEDL